MKKFVALTVFIACFFIENVVYADYFVDPPYSIPYTLNGHTYDQMMQQIHTGDLVNDHSLQQVYYCNSSYFTTAKPVISAVANAYNPFAVSVFVKNHQYLFSSDTDNWDYVLTMGNASDENLDFCVVYYTSDGGMYWTENTLGSVFHSHDLYGDFTYTDFIRSTFDLYWSAQPFVPSSWATNQFQDGQSSKANRLIIPASSFGTATVVPNARRAVVLEAFYALRPSADGGCDQTIPASGNGAACVSSWNYLDDDYWAYDQLKNWYGCTNASVWERKGDTVNGVSCGFSVNRRNVSYYSNLYDYGFYGNYGRGGQCKHFANLITYRSGADTRYHGSYDQMTLNSFLLNSPANLTKVKEGDIVFSKNIHTFVVVEIKRSGSTVTGLDAIDSNYVGGRNNEIIGRHVFLPSELRSKSYRVWTGSAYYNTNYDPNSHW